MKYLHFNPEYRATEPVECFKYKGEFHPTDNGYDNNKVFIYGAGYVAITKSTKRYMVDPLPENYNALDIIKVYKEYGKHIALRLIAKRYSSTDCDYSGYSSELTNIIKFGESYDAFLQLAYDIDNTCVVILKEKYGVYIKYKDFYFGDINEYNKIPAYYINPKTGQYSVTKRQAHYFSGNIELSLMGLFTMDALYNSVSHEVNLKSMITELSKVFPIIGRIYDNDNESDCLELRTKLENMSVLQQTEYLYGKEISDKATALNLFKLQESEYHKELVKNINYVKC